MARRIVQEVYWRFNPSTKTVEIVSDGKVLEVTTLSQAPSRLAHHRNAASGVAYVEAAPRKRAVEVR